MDQWRRNLKTLLFQKVFIYYCHVIILKESSLAPGVPCPYLDGQTFIQEHFYALDLSPAEHGVLLRAGWRRFGAYFFRPKCDLCRACEPLRLVVSELRMTASQKRVWNKNRGTALVARPLSYRPEIYEVYAEHSRLRFGRETDPQEFLETFFVPCPTGFQTEYSIDGELAGVGFCDRGDLEISSIYFVFKEKFKHFSLGTFSVLKECELAASWGLSYYNLGYYVRENAHMRYKGEFGMREIMDWDSESWSSG